MPLSALTASPRFASRGIEAVGEDSLETFERTSKGLGESARTLRVPGDDEPEPVR
jgi:hypothetical protein